MRKVLPLLSLFIVSACSQETVNLNTFENNDTSIASKQKKEGSNTKGFVAATYDIKSYFTKYSKNNEKQLNLSHVIHNLKSDIIALHGVSNPSEIKTFNERYLKDLNYRFYSSYDAGSQNNSVILSKFSMAEVKNNMVGEIKYPLKSLYKLKATVNSNYSFTFYTVNFKTADTPGFGQDKRNAEIEEMKAYIRTNQKSNFREKYLMLGNLNGSPTQDDLQTIIDPRSSGLSFHDVITEDFGSTNDIFSLESNKGRSRPDYVLVSPGMFDEYIYQSVKIHNQQDKKLLQSVSDHYPVTANFTLPQ